MKIVATVVGAEDLRRMLTELLPNESKNLLRRVMFATAKDLRDDIKGTAPVGTGANAGKLRDAIIAKRERGTRESVEASVTIKRDETGESPTRYWHFLEFGTTLKAARPFIVPAAERMATQLREIFEAKFFKQLAATLARKAKAGGA
jgi:HK97 gp10 family phage protein